MQDKKFESKQLVDAGLCASFAEARRMILCMDSDKLAAKLQAKEAEKWGRRKVRTDGKNWKNVAERFE